MPTDLEIKQYANFTSEKVFEYAKELFGFDPAVEMVLEIQLVPRKDGGRSWGGRRHHGSKSEKEKPYMKLNFNRVKRGNWSIRNEYEHIETDPEIGHRFCKTWEEYVLTTVCHEVAHAIELTAEIYRVKIDYPLSQYRMLNKNPNDHGSLWQHIYRLLRNHFVNNAAQLLKLPKKKKEVFSENTLGKVEIKHGFVGLKFTKGVFEFVEDFTPTDEATKNHEKYGLPLNQGTFAIKTPNGVERIQVKTPDYRIIA